MTKEEAREIARGILGDGYVDDYYDTSIGCELMAAYERGVAAAKREANEEHKLLKEAARKGCVVRKRSTPKTSWAWAVISPQGCFLGTGDTMIDALRDAFVAVVR